VCLCVKESERVSEREREKEREREREREVKKVLFKTFSLTKVDTDYR
jgi:hypothetical protein